MTQLIHAVARIRAMESGLLNRDSLNRMISASSFELAYAVLDELGYAKEASMFRDTYDYEKAIELGLLHTSQIFKSFGIKSIQKILTIVFDIQNIVLYVKKIDEIISSFDNDISFLDIHTRIPDILSSNNIDDIFEIVSSDEVISYGYYSKEV